MRFSLIAAEHYLLRFGILSHGSIKCLIFRYHDALGHFFSVARLRRRRLSTLAREAGPLRIPPPERAIALSSLTVMNGFRFSPAASSSCWSPRGADDGA